MQRCRCAGVPVCRSMVCEYRCAAPGARQTRLGVILSAECQRPGPTSINGVVRSALVAAMALYGVSGAVQGQKAPAQSVSQLRAASGLDVTLWAAEPSLSNPTNIAVDERGRVWVLEAVNYRGTLRGAARPAPRRRPHRHPRRHRRRRQGRHQQGVRPEPRAPRAARHRGAGRPRASSRSRRTSSSTRRTRAIASSRRKCCSPAGAASITITACTRSCSGRTAATTSTRATKATTSPIESGTAGAVAARRRCQWTTVPSRGAGAYFEGAAMVVNPDGTGLAGARPELPQPVRAGASTPSATSGRPTTTMTATPGRGRTM